ncbi:hypothetical protein NQ317_014880 [Molorchus minor]|uniref:Protein HEXIM1 n=1 Tax=Molorchus minor TaxID=1323400 RepID=A0ABQ9JEE6_9CUCU|nr:hypothetical protein NQ317_014880 [Molorchus minor]
MSELCINSEQNEPDLKSVEKLPKDDVVQQSDARAPLKAEHRPKLPEAEIPPKKRKTRRGKSKRRHPYVKNSKTLGKMNKLIKPEAPHNSNQFLLEDHGLIEELDDLKPIDQGSPSTITRTRESSFSVDSDGEFYSSPDDEEQYLIKEFDDQYESLHAERLQAMSKSQLIEEYIMLENKLEQLYKRLQKREERGDDSEDSSPELKREVERLTIENERLRRENDLLRSKAHASDSEDSETDSSDSCSSSSASSSTSCHSRSASPSSQVDYTQTNGHPSPNPNSSNPV